MLYVGAWPLFNPGKTHWSLVIPRLASTALANAKDLGTSVSV
jgi:hypothetical protein